MAKTTAHYVCQECGADYPQWSGRCEACGAWNSISEEAPRDSVPLGAGKARKGRSKEHVEFLQLDGPAAELPRRVTGITELDRVCGGGMVPGSALLVGGDPGIGKSTLLLQALCAIGGKAACVYISGEESVEQVRMRAGRLGLAEAPVRLAAATNIRTILDSLETDRKADGAEVLVIDSIQTMYMDALDAAPGTVTQVRACAGELVRFAKRHGITVFLVGHVTKEGQIAGPRVVEHMVDTVLYFESKRGHQFRILRAVKNRYGPTDEIGVFEMSDAGLREVTNPSSLFLADQPEDVQGAVVFAGIEGTRPLLVEIQALVAPSVLGSPRRAVVGWDSGRLAMTLAVLEARCGLALGAQDVYLNVAGGLRITEPAADLAVAAAIVSSLTGEPLPHNTVVFGEVGLSGEVRGVGQRQARLKEAAKLGFARALTPRQTAEAEKHRKPSLEILEIGHLQDLLAHFATAAHITAEHTSQEDPLAPTHGRRH